VRTGQRLAEALVDILDAPGAGFDPAVFADRVAGWCSRLLDVDGVGVALVESDGRLTLAAATSPARDLISRAGLDRDDDGGFWQEVVTAGAPGYQDDLAAGAARWPPLSSLAHQGGNHVVHAWPMRYDGATVGVLSVFSGPTGELAAPDRAVGAAIARTAAARLVQQRWADSDDALVGQLRTALTSRVVIEQAKGIIAEQVGIGMPSAFQLLRNYARRHNLRLDRLAAAVATRTGEMAAIDWAAEFQRLRRR
jgi:hypothetical protein